MTPTILLTGKNGQVGSELVGLLSPLGKVIALGRHELDLLVPDNIRRVVRDVRPQLVVNAAAYTAVDAAESDEAKAYAINANGPRVVAEESKKVGAAVVHYSTDYVFDGLKVTPYEESNLPRPINIYGKTKLAGEQAIRNSGVPHLIFRTSWVYATRGRNFMLTVLRLATEREELRVVCDQFGAPTLAREIAQTTRKILERVADWSNGTFFPSGISGTYHMTAAGATTRYDFARAILEEASRMPQSLLWFASATGGRPLIARRIVPITTEEYPTAASRPAYSVLSNSLLTRTFGVEMQDWRTQLRVTFAANHEPLKEVAASDF